MKKSICLGLLAVLFLGMAFLVRPKTLEAASWGLSFSEPGQPPTGNTAQKRLSQWDAAYLRETDEKVLYLTFDAGYENGCTAKILDTLQEKEVPATFFVVGTYVDRNPELVRRMHREGHLVGNHSQHHYDMTTLNAELFSEELRLVEEKYRAVTGAELDRFYRPPQGCYTEESLRMAQSLGYKTVFWSLAYVDWQQDAQKTQEEAFQKLLPRAHNGAILLLHSTSKTNMEILGELIDRLRAEGYRFGRLEEIFENPGKNLPTAA